MFSIKYDLASFYWLTRTTQNGEILLWGVSKYSDKMKRVNTCHFSIIYTMSTILFMHNTWQSRSRVIFRWHYLVFLGVTLVCSYTRRVRRLTHRRPSATLSVSVNCFVKGIKTIHIYRWLKYEFLLKYLWVIGYFF